MKKFIHPQKNNTLIKFQNGASYVKHWIYYRSFINDRSSISYSYITKLKAFNYNKKTNNICLEINNSLVEQNSFFNEVQKINNFFNKKNSN